MWIRFFLTGVAEQARDATERAKRLEELRNKWRQQLSQKRASSLPLILIDSLFDLPVLTIPSAARILNVTYPTAQRHVIKLVDLGILRQVGGSASSYNKVYGADAILDIIGSA